MTALILASVALGIALPAVIMCLVLSAQGLRPTRGPDGSWLRLDGNTLHGRIVYVDHLGWEREIARWGLDSNGLLAFSWHSDHTLYTGYIISGPQDVSPELQTAAGAPYHSFTHGAEGPPALERTE